MPRPLALVGAHVSSAGGIGRCVPYAAKIGAEVIQVFLSSPRAWAVPPENADADASFAADCAVPVFVHAPYLVNFGSPSPATLARSTQTLTYALRRGRAIGARGVVVHAGSAVLGNSWHDGMKQVRNHLLPALDAVPNAPRLLVEPMASSASLASDADSLGAYLDMLGRDERIGVCLDTCHMHAAGHDLSTAASFAAALQAYGQAAGRGRIGLIHVNDSRDPVGSKRDRHEAVGLGTIGRAAFAALFRTPTSRRVPMVVETNDTGHTADIATLKTLRAEVTAGG